MLWSGDLREEALVKEPVRKKPAPSFHKQKKKVRNKKGITSKKVRRGVDAIAPNHSE